MALEITPGSPEQPDGVASITTPVDTTKPASALGSDVTPTSGVGIKAKTELKEIEATRNSKTGGGVSGRAKIAGTSDLIALMKTSRGGVISTALTTVLILAGMLFFAITPAISTIQTQLEKNQALQDVNAQMNTKYQKLVTLKKKEDDNAASFAKFNDLFSLFGVKNPDGTREKEVYAEFNTMSAASGLAFQSAVLSEDPAGKKAELASGVQTNISSIRPRDPNVADRTRFLRINFTVTGNIADLPKLLAALETSKRIYTIETISIGQNKGPGGIVAGQSIQITVLTLYWGSDTL